VRPSWGLSGGTSLTVLCDVTQRADGGDADTWEGTEMDASHDGERRV